MIKKYILSNGLQLIFKKVQDTYIQFGEGSHIKKPRSGHERTNFFEIDDFVRLWMAKTFPFYGKYQYQKGGGPSLEKHPVDVILFNLAKYIFHHIPHICNFFTQAKFLENRIYTQKHQFFTLNL